MARRVILPSLPVADEDVARMRLWEAGRHMARQEMWHELDALILHADTARLTTPGGASEARLMIDGAQSDVSAAAIHAIDDGQVPDLSGLSAMERIAAEQGESHAIALVVAQAHLRIGQAWSRSATPERDRSHAHFERAQALLAPYDARALGAPCLAALEAELAEMLSPAVDDVVSAYRRLLALDPGNALHLRAFGLACQRAESEELPLLTQHAARLLPQTGPDLGQGGYVWLFFDALKHCDAALGALDVERFIQGMRDILRRQPSQHLINELAAFCALSMGPDRACKQRSAEKARARLHDCLSWILSEHLHELHPALWTTPDTTPMTLSRHTLPRAHIVKGREMALRVIARHFADQLADGSSIAFSPAGMYRLPAI